MYQKKNDKKMRILIIFFSVLNVLSGCVYSQNKTIKGRVISDQFEFLIGVPIIINDSVEAGKTDKNGFFRIEIPDSINKILLKDVGLESAIVNLVDKCDEVEVVMLMRSTDDFLTPKKVERLRRKRFQKLPELHRAAFARGVFKTDSPCYTQDFVKQYSKNGQLKDKRSP